MNKVKTHFVDLESPDGTCKAMTFIEPKYISYLILSGWTVFDYTESLDLKPEYVEKESCYVPET